MFYVVILVIALTFVLHRWVTSKRSDSVTCLIGKTAIVTGGNEGIGYAIVELLASRGCKVIIADKANSEKSVQKIKKLTKNDNVSSKHLDLASFASVRKFADEVKLSEDKVDILINNAGINAYDSVKTEDGLSSVMQVNYFGSFLLTHLLIDKSKKSGQARIVFTGSIAVFLNNLTADNLDRYDFGQTSFGHIYYGNSKYCNVSAAQEFGAKLKDYNIMVFAADPGTIKTRIFFVSNDTFWSAFSKKAMLWCFGHEPSVGAQTAFHVATSTDLEGKTGGYYFLCRPWIKPWNSRNPEFCRKIWKRSEELVKSRPNEKI